jgi:AraC family transcriptional regulator
MNAPDSSPPNKPFQLQIRYILLPLLMAILIYALYLGHYLGAFKSVLIEEKTVGPLHLVFKSHIGPYHKINEVLVSVETWAKENNFDCSRTFGEYLDNPEWVDEKRLRANVGCVVQEPIAVLPTDLQQKTIPEIKYVAAIFEGASSIGPLKVYPKIKEYFKKMNYEYPESSLEIYQIHSQTAMTTQYLFVPK